MYASVGIVCSDSGNEDSFTITDYSLATTNNPNALGVGLTGGKKMVGTTQTKPRLTNTNCLVAQNDDDVSQRAIYHQWQK